MRDLTVAAVCMHSIPGEVDKNLLRMRSFALEASRQGAQVVCFPEASASGYTLKDPSGLFTESVSQGIIESVVDMAGASGLLILAGTVEAVPGERPFITQIIAGPEGLAGLYRKTHLSPMEKERYQPGHHIQVFRHKGLAFGVQLCYESHFPEISTLLALQGAEAVFMPHASPRGNAREKTESWLRHLPARAFDNGLYVVACNQVGDTAEGLSFPGAALVLGPSGRVIARYLETQEGMIFAELKGEELAQVRDHRMKYFLPERRPELYVPISSPSGGPLGQKKGTKRNGSFLFVPLQRP